MTRRARTLPLILTAALTAAACIRKAVKAFNTSQADVVVKPVLLPEGNYSDQVKAAAAAGGLPDILDVDGPTIVTNAWPGNLQPLDTCVPAELRNDLLPTILKQGTYNDKLYGVGTLESGLGLYARKSVLRKAGIRIPAEPSEAWPATERTATLAKLKEAGFAKSLDLQDNQIVGGGGSPPTH